MSEAETCRLKPISPINVWPGNISLSHFYNRNSKIWVSMNFRDYLLAHLSERNVARDVTTIGRTTLLGAANDQQIRSELPKDYVFEDIDTFLITLAALLTAECSVKKRRIFLSDRHPNLFYVKMAGGKEVIVVSVVRFAPSQKWRCFADKLSKYPLRPNCWIFSAST